MEINIPYWQISILAIINYSACYEFHHTLRDKMVSCLVTFLHVVTSAKYLQAIFHYNCVLYIRQELSVFSCTISHYAS